MRRGGTLLLPVVTPALLAVGFGPSASPVVPGGKIGTMILVRGIEPKADDELWGRHCNPVIPHPGRYRRTCLVPHIERLFIGYGDWEVTRKALDSAWRELTWKMWLDGRRVDLPRFGTSERTIYFFPPAGGKNVIEREWSVTLVGVTSGKHVLRYRFGSPSRGTTDAAWTFTVG